MRVLHEPLFTASSSFIIVSIRTGRHNGSVKEPTRHTIIRQSDEPKLEIGETVPVKEGVVGVVIARYVPSDPKSDEVHYIVEVRPEDEKA